MIILGLDIATTTGYSVLDDGKLIACGKFTISDTDPYRYRFKQIRKEIGGLVISYRPDLVILEGVYQGPNAKTTALLNNFRGIVMERIPLKIELESVYVSTVKKDVLGQGKNHTKRDVFNWAIKKFNLKGLNFNEDNDITDSILLSFWAYKNNTNKK